MPTRSSKAAKAEEPGGEEAQRLVEDDSDGDSSDDAAEREKRRIAKAALTATRQEHMAEVGQLRSLGMEKMREAGMLQRTTEGLGDCWLIAMLAGYELDLSLVSGVPAATRKEVLTPWRQQLVDFAPHIDTKGFDASGEALGIEYLKMMAVHFDVPKDLVHACDVTKNWKVVRDRITRKLKPWKKARHFGTWQEPVHVCMGLILQKNILEIDLPSITRSGTGMLRATLACYAAQPCPHSC